MRRLIILFMAILLFTEPLVADALNPHHYSTVGSIRFGSATNIPGSPFIAESSLPTEKQLSLSGLAMYPLFGLFLPAGYFWLGSTNLTSTVVSLMNKTENLNKLTKEITADKSSGLLPYLKKDGMELLTYYLHGKQKIVHISGSKKMICPLSKNGQRNKGVSALMMRDLVNSFIQQFQHQQKRCAGAEGEKDNVDTLTPASGTDYEDALRTFLTQLGFVTWSEQTLLDLKDTWPDLNILQREWNLYQILKEHNIVDNDGAALAKTSTSNILRVLSKANLTNNALQKNILHDLGLLHKEDLEKIKSDFPELLTDGGLKEPYKYLLKNNLAQLIPSIQQTLDRSPKSLSDFKEKLDLAILKTLLPDSQQKSYLKRHHVTLNKKDMDSQLTLLKLALIDTIQQNLPENETYNYLTLETDLQTTQAFIVKVLHQEKINNDLYRIVSMKGEDIALSSILCITSVGFLTVGTLRLIVFSLNAILQHKMHTLSTLSSTGNTATMTAELTQQIATLTQVVQVLNYTISGFLIGVGTINLSLTIYQIITKLYEINRLQNSKKIYKLLEDHLKEIPMDTPGQQKLQFNQETTCYLHNLKQKSLFNSLGLNSLLLFFSSLNVLNGSFLLLALLGISFAVILSPIIGYGFGIFTALVAIPVALLVFREIRLKGRLNFATQTVQILKDALTKKGIELEHKQQQFLQIFLNNVNDSMGVAICSTEMKYYQSLLHKNHSFSGIESNLIQLHEVRTRALKHWKRLLSDPKTSAPLTQLVNEELARNHIRLKPETLTHPDATTYRNGVDVLLEAFHPGMLTNPTGTFLSTHTPPIYIEPFFYEWDIHLSNLFNYTFQIYNNMRRDLQDYRYLLHKKNLQNRYFNTPLSKQEISLLLERYNKRKRENRFTFRFSNFNKEIVALNTIQKPLSGKAPWDDHFMPELTQLMEYNRTFKDTITNLAKRGYEEPKLDLPEHSQVELLINYFLPVSWAN